MSNPENENIIIALAVLGITFLIIAMVRSLRKKDPIDDIQYDTDSTPGKPAEEVQPPQNTASKPSKHLAPPIIRKTLSDIELINHLRSLEPRLFEYYVANLFMRMGYTPTVTPSSHDGGIDIRLQKGDVGSFVQCKKYIVKKVSLHDIRDFYGSVSDSIENGTAFFVTTNVFTPEAIDFITSSKLRSQIKLLDCERLVRCIRLVEHNREPIVNFQGKPHMKFMSCPLCRYGVLVGRQNSLNGTKFLGCSLYPKCSYTRQGGGRRTTARRNHQVREGH